MTAAMYVSSADLCTHRTSKNHRTVKIVGLAIKRGWVLACDTIGYLKLSCAGDEDNNAECVNSQSC